MALETSGPASENLDELSESPWTIFMLRVLYLVPGRGQAYRAMRPGLRRPSSQ
jgi:hypothetical protein